MQSRTHELLAAVAAGALLLGLAGCAPEPGGSPGTGAEQGPREDSWADGDSAEQSGKSTEIPESFPEESFALPQDAVVDDVGEREEGGAWFVVLRAESADAADRLWAEVIADNDLVLSEETETSDGGVSAVLESRALVAAALSIPQEDGSVLLSYDLTEVGA